VNVVFSQSFLNKNEDVKKIDSLISKNRTSLKTDILPEILSTAINNGIISKSGSTIKISTTIFGLKKLFDSTVSIDTNYKKERFARNFSFGAGIDIDDANKINGVQSLLKIAFLNKRDLTDESHLNKPAKKIYDKMILIQGSFNNLLDAAISQPLITANRSGKIDNETFKKLSAALITYTNSQKETDFKNLQQVFAPYKDKVALDTTIFLKFQQHKLLIDSLEKNLVTAINAGNLITFNFNSNYVNKAWDSLSFKLEWIKGLGGQKDSTKPWDFYAGTFYNLKTDTLIKKSLQKQVGSIKLGINKVFAKRNDGGPLFEALFAGGYDHVFKGSLYPTEKRNSFFVDFTFTIKISQAISVPFEIKSDLTNKGNLFGFLNFKWDILTTKSK